MSGIEMPYYDEIGDVFEKDVTSLKDIFLGLDDFLELSSPKKIDFMLQKSQKIINWIRLRASIIRHEEKEESAELKALKKQIPNLWQYIEEAWHYALCNGWSILIVNGLESNRKVKNIKKDYFNGMQYTGFQFLSKYWFYKPVMAAGVFKYIKLPIYNEEGERKMEQFDYRKIFFLKNNLLYPIGNSMLLRLWDKFFIQYKAIWYSLSYLEKFGLLPMLLKRIVQAGMTVGEGIDDKRRAQMQDIFENLNKWKLMEIPYGYEIENWSPVPTNNSDFLNLSRELDTQIAMEILGTSLVVSQNNAGSYGRDELKKVMSHSIIENDKAISSIVINQALRNTFGIKEGFKYKESKYVKIYGAEQLEILSRGGVILTRKKQAELLGISEDDIVEMDTNQDGGLEIEGGNVNEKKKQETETPIETQNMEEEVTKSSREIAKGKEKEDIKNIKKEEQNAKKI